MLYKVLKEGIRQRTSEGGWSSPKVGEVIQVSDLAASSMIAEGWIEEQEPKSRKKGKAAAWLGLGSLETPNEEEKE